MDMVMVPRTCTPAFGSLCYIARGLLSEVRAVLAGTGGNLSDGAALVGRGR